MSLTGLSRLALVAGILLGRGAKADTSAYRDAVLSDAPLAYYRLTEATIPTPDVATNSGSLGPTGNGAHFPGLNHQVPGALAASSDTAAGYSAIDVASTDGGVPTRVPYNAALNPTGPFTVEAWVKPTINGAANAQCPLINRVPDDLADLQGWDFFQGSAAEGWEFRMFNGSGSDTVFDLNGGPYVVGAWNHLAAVYDGLSATLYVNGVEVDSSAAPNGHHVPNTVAPLSIGGYSDGIQNPFTGAIDEVAIYTNALTADQLMAHYDTGTNGAPLLAYDTLVIADGAVEYLRLNEPAHDVATNSGTLGAAANGVVNTANGAVGPRSPVYEGLEPNNNAVSFNGTNSFIELGNPTGLNFTGHITLEAWLKPAAAQNALADVIAHGVNDTDNAEVMLRLTDVGTASARYEVGSWDGTNTYGASSNIPSGDLGGTNWVHLAGTYDGAGWNLYRNGVNIASVASPIGAVLVDNANWAIGARGRWKYAEGYPAAGQDRAYAGAIDEAAIYNTSLSATRVQAHYFAGKYGVTNPPSPFLTISPAGTNVTVTWLFGVLQQATFVAGPYTDLGSAASPYVVPASAVQRFYRVRL